MTDQPLLPLMPDSQIRHLHDYLVEYKLSFRGRPIQIEVTMYCDPDNEECPANDDAEATAPVDYDRAQRDSAAEHQFAGVPGNGHSGQPWE